jgi:hypothetical protein
MRNAGVIPVRTQMYFEPVGVHDHWHLKNFISMHLAPLTQTDPPTDRRSRKIGFCLFDTDQMPADQRPPAFAPQTFTGCGDGAVEVGANGHLGRLGRCVPALVSVPGDRCDRSAQRLLPAVRNRQSAFALARKEPGNNTHWIDVALDTAAKTVGVIDSGATPCDGPSADPG